MSENAKYFDLHTTGVGYLNRVRTVKPDRGEHFLAVDISALQGAADNVHYTRFDCRVYGKEAIRVIERLRAPIESDAHKVFVAFKIGDLYSETFIYKKGDRAGETGVSLKSRLLRIAWAKVDGETVYTAPRSAEPEQRQAA
jgi:hypothetical protein